MDEMNGDGAFADGGGYALDAACADVADGEYARQACFEHQRETGERPLRRVGAIGLGGGTGVRWKRVAYAGIHIAAGENETFFVELDAAF
jgi:hypothetical protein